MGKLTEVQKADIVDSYNQGISITCLSCKYKINFNSVSSILKVRKVKFRGKRKYFFDEKYFDIIDSPEKAYWLGFIYADGNVYKSTLAIKLANIDIDHIVKFKEVVNAQHPIKPVRNKNASVLKISSVKLVESLSKVGVMPNKSLIIKFPTWLSENLVSDFVRGVFDGDGWLTYYKPKDQNKLIWSIGWCSGSKEFLEVIRDKINLETGSLFKRKGGYQLSYTGDVAVASVCNFLYANTSPSLDRKCEKYTEFVKYVSNYKTVL